MKYIGFYGNPNEQGVSPAAVNKMNYIYHALKESGFSPQIIACNMVSDKGMKAADEEINGICVHYFTRLVKSHFKLLRICQVFRQNIILFFWLLCHVKRKESVLVYHSLGLMRCVYWAKKIKKFQMILETEEIYNDVFLKSKLSQKMEKKFIACADKYIFPTELLHRQLNTEKKPYVLIHGTYQVEPDRGERFEDDKIHVVYAGTFDPIKGGAVTTTITTRWLPENYHVHILGFGTEEQKSKLLDLMEQTNRKSAAKVSYDGCLSGEEYICFLQKCQIGMSTQNPDAAFNATSFPSKILSYMANGLRVVSVRIPAREGSAVGGDIYYYEEQTPQRIAEAIISVDFEDGYNGRERIRRLDKRFIREMTQLLEK